MAIRQIRTFHDEILYKVCRPVARVDGRIREILDDMAETMYRAPNGCGLAACQVGILRRLVVADTGTGLFKLVNPEIISREGEQTAVEGCLSFPGVWGTVRRPRRITVKAWDENGKPVILNAEGALARCLCHEIDHLDGIVFTGKVIRYLRGTRGNGRNRGGIEQARGNG